MAFQLTLVLLSVVVLSLVNVNLGKRVARQNMPGGQEPADTTDTFYKSAYNAAVNALNLGANCIPTVTATQQVVNGMNYYFTLVIPAGCSSNAGKTCKVEVYVSRANQATVNSNICSDN